MYIKVERVVIKTFEASNIDIIYEILQIISHVNSTYCYKILSKRGFVFEQ